VRLSPLGTSATNWPIVPTPDDRRWWIWSSRCNENWQGKPKYSVETCPSATLPSTNPIWPDLSSNPGRRSEKQATNRHGVSLRAYEAVSLLQPTGWRNPLVAAGEMESDHTRSLWILVIPFQANSSVNETFALNEGSLADCCNIHWQNARFAVALWGTNLQ
jgi:hypothetical protein